MPSGDQLVPSWYGITVVACGPKLGIYRLQTLAKLLDLTLLAGAKILEIYATDFTVSQKRDSSPVTEADIAAEAIILNGLGQTCPDIPVVAEEAVSVGQVPPPSEKFFLVDPLDGSKEFVSRNGEFTVNIALIENGEPVLGVVYAPALGRIWWGCKGEGSFGAHVVAAASGQARIVDRAAIGVRKAPEKLCAVGSRSHGSGEGDPRLGHFRIGSFKSAGSSLKFCLLAAGEADLYPRFGRTMEWDTAAGDAVLRAAGGSVTCLDGTPLRYGKRNRVDKSDFTNPQFIATGDPRLGEIPITNGNSNLS
jgi:3'(2'), 5'-bisphosphate nucleotidase